MKSYPLEIPFESRYIYQRTEGRDKDVTEYSV